MTSWIAELRQRTGKPAVKPAAPAPAPTTPGAPMRRVYGTAWRTGDRRSTSGRTTTGASRLRQVRTAGTTPATNEHPWARHRRHRRQPSRHRRQEVDYANALNNPWHVGCATCSRCCRVMFSAPRGDGRAAVLRRRLLTWSRASTRLQHNRHLRKRLQRPRRAPAPATKAAPAPARTGSNNGAPADRDPRRRGDWPRAVGRFDRVSARTRKRRAPPRPSLVHRVRLTTISNSIRRRSRVTVSCRRCYTSFPGNGRISAISLVNP